MRILLFTLLLSGSTAFGAESISIKEAFINKESGCGFVFTSNDDTGSLLVKFYEGSKEIRRAEPSAIYAGEGDEKVQAEFVLGETIIVLPMDEPNSNFFEAIHVVVNEIQTVKELCPGMMKVSVKNFPWQKKKKLTP